ncbi:tail fiber domain-containing protein [Bdellovibrio sp. HCB290]|uniref:tail fiber domain-containing protein n=1 Tax=Bdellovibrio sp. HCB290 TaxID=3394356 RepID=UPI0039B5CFD3
MSYQGRILKPDGQPLEYNSVSFIFEITNPNGNCVIYREQKNGVNLTGTGGVFDVPIGSGTKLFPPSPTVGLMEIFNNSTALDCGDGSNNVSGSYTPSAQHGRLLYVKFHDGVGWNSITPETEIRSVPYAAHAKTALSANTLSGKTATEFVEKITIPNCPADTFLTYTSGTFSCAGVTGAAGGTVTNVTSGNSYLTIINGTSTPALTLNVGTGANTVAAGNDSRFGNALKVQGVDVDATAPSNGQVLKFDGSKWAPAADSANSGTVTSVSGTAGQITVATGTTTPSLSLANVGTAGTYVKVTTDAQGRVTSGSTSLSAADIPSLDFSKITSGLPTTLSGYGITDAIRNLGGTPGFKSGTNATKGAAGTAGNIYISTDTKEIYRDNGTTWDLVGSASGTGGTITGVTAGAGLTGGGTSGAVTVAVNAGTGANQIVQLDASSKLPAIDGSALTNLSPSALSAVVPISKGGTGQSSATAGFNALSPLSIKGDLLTRDGTNNIRLGVGTNGQILSADSAEAGGLKWITPSAGTVTSVSATAPLAVATGTSTPAISISSGTGAAQVLRWNSTNWTASYFNFADLKSSAGLAQIPNSCTASQTLVWQTPSDTFACTNISVSGANFAAQSAGLIFAGPTAGSAAPTFRAIASTDLPSGTLAGSGTAGYVPYYSAAATLANSPLNVSSTNVGLNTATPTSKFHVTGYPSPSGQNYAVRSDLVSLQLPFAASDNAGYYAGVGVRYWPGGYGSTVSGVKSSTKCEINTNSTCNGIYGGYFGLENTSTQTNNNFTAGAAVYADSHINTAAGTTTTVDGVSARVRNTGGAVTTARAVEVLAPTNTGTIDTYAGVNIDDISAVTGITNSYALRYNHATLPFVVNSAGSVGIGTSAPTTLLNVSQTLPDGSKPVVRFENLKSNISGLTTLAALAPNIGDTYSKMNILVGKDYANYQAGSIEYNYNSTDSSLRRLSLGHKGYSPNFHITEPGKVGIGTTAPTAPLTVFGGALLGDKTTFPTEFATIETNTHSNALYNNTATTGTFGSFGTWMRVTPPSNSTLASQALSAGLSFNVPSGVTVNSNSDAMWINVSRNRYAANTDNGTVTSIRGATIGYGHENTIPANTPITTNAYGLVINPYATTGTITNMYDIYLATRSAGATVTNRYGLYQTDSAADNYFNGYVGLGTNAPRQPLEINKGHFFHTGGDLVHFFNAYHNGALRYGGYGGASGYPGSIGYTPSTGNFYIQTGATAGTSDTAATMTTRFAIDRNGNVGIGTNVGPRLFYVNGTSGGTNAWENLSDRRLKKNIEIIPDSLKKIASLRGVTFDWQHEVRPDLKFTHKRDMGVIAQEVERVFPEAVEGDDQGFKSVAYTKLIGPMIEAFKEIYTSLSGIKADLAEQKREIASLKEENKALKQQVEEISEIKKALCKKDTKLDFCH